MSEQLYVIRTGIELTAQGEKASYITRDGKVVADTLDVIGPLNEALMDQDKGGVIDEKPGEVTEWVSPVADGTPAE